jgi:hypothetical protein
MNTRALWGSTLAAVFTAAIAVLYLRNDESLNVRWLRRHPELTCSDGIDATFHMARTSHPFGGADPENFLTPLCDVEALPLPQMARHADVVTLLCTAKFSNATCTRVPDPDFVPNQAAYGNTAHLALYHPNAETRQACTTKLDAWTAAKLCTRSRKPMPNYFVARLLSFVVHLLG